MAISPGTRLGPYEIIERIGAGGMGEVFRARDERIGRDVAIKVLPASFAADGDRLRRFEQEARTAGTLNHPNLVTIYDIGRENGSLYIVMELLDGETLRDKLSSLRGDLKKNLLVIADVADAIAAAHRAGVVHRDLKPENIIVTSSGYTKVVDFGLAKLANAPSVETNATEVKKTDPGVVLGTVGYMSPEQAQGKPADQRSDIFALGCILYEALSGQRAFNGKSSVDTLHNIIHVDPEPVRSATPELRRITRKCLAKDPDERYQSAKDLAIDLRAAVRELGSATDITAPPPKRSTAAVLVAGFVLAAIAATIAWYAARNARVAAPLLSIRPLTTSGDVISASISPDGKYFAYVTSRKGMQAMWLRQIGTSQSIPLVAPAPVAYWAHTFSRDGTSIYFTTKRGEFADVVGTLYQISTLGGTPRKILAGIESAISFSPDGKQFAFLRTAFPTPGQSALLIANADGSGIRALAFKSAPELFVPIFFAGPAWSPDGERIVTAVVSSAGREQARFAVFEVKSGTERRLGSTPLRQAAQSVWLPEGHGLIAVAAAPDGGSAQLWRIDYPSGNAHPITSGFAEYRNPTISADGKALVAVAAQYFGGITVQGSRGEQHNISATQYDGTNGVSFAPDGRVVFTTLSNGAIELWVCDRSGGGRQQFATLTTTFSREPLVNRAGQVVFIGRDESGVSLWSVNLDGSSLTKLSPVSFSSVAALSPDGTTIYFNADFGSGTMLYRMPLSGGRPTAVGSARAGRPAISPDGKTIAAMVQIGSRWTLALLAAENGALVRTFNIIGSNLTHLRWSPDGKTIYYNTNSQLDTVDVATGKVRTIVAYEAPEGIYSFDVAPDGMLVYSHGPLSRDAYLITGFE